MEKKTIACRNKLPLVVVLLLYLVAGGALISFYRYQINPDGISYISIAQKYVNGDFKNAVNGHFSPLFSWLLIPLLYVGLDPLLATKLLNLSIGLVTIAAVYTLSCKFRLRDEIRTALLLTTVPVLLYFAFYLITPDLLVSCVLLFYFQAIFDSNYADSRRHGLFCGIVGGIAFLAKSFSFPFFLCHFPFMNLIHYFRNTTASARKRILNNFVTGGVVFMLISSPWIAALTAKYGYVTLSTQSIHNLQYIGPTPPQHSHFVKPPNETAISIWEDPFSVLPLGTWSPFESATAFKRWMKFFINNIQPALTICIGFSPLAFALCMGYLLILLRRPKQLLSQDGLLYPLIASFIHAAGYCLILLDERYLWIICFMFMVTSGYILERLFQHAFFTRAKRIILLFLFILSFALTPLNNLMRSVHTGKDLYRLSETLKQYVVPTSRIATSNYWYRSLFLAFHLQAPIYGTAEKKDPETLYQEMERYAIDYYIMWRETDTPPPSSKYREIGYGTYKQKTVTVFQRRNHTQ